jgi:hypothetical protein
MSAKHNHTSFDVRLGHHYILFIKVPLVQSYILLRIPHLGLLLYRRISGIAIPFSVALEQVKYPEFTN